MTDIEDERKSRSKIASKQQLSAANPNISVWVEASAGTGKTKVLSDRVLRILLNSDNPHPERILCLTYTKAGAVEMKSRIFERLSEWAVISEKKLEENIIKLFPEGQLSFDEFSTYKERARTLFAVLLDTPGGIKIQTIHGFCQDLLSRFPIEAGVSPYFEVMESNEQSDILEQIRRDLLNDLELSALNDKAKYMMYITENMKEANFDKALQEIIENHSKLQSIFNHYPNFDSFVQNLARRIGVDSDKLIIDHQTDFMNFLRGYLATIVDTLNHGTPAENETASLLNSIIKNNFKAADFSLAQKLFLTGNKTPKIKGTKSSLAYNPDIAVTGQKIADKLNSTLRLITKQRLFFASRAIFGLAHELFSKYDEYKKQRAKLDYDDLIFYAGNLLADSSASDWVLYKLDGGIDHILVDEAQDTSPEQWKIIKSLSEEFFAGEGSKNEQRTIFVVGDRKQSIFSFQGADPQKMEDMSHYFQNKIHNGFEKINLDVSFRSTSAVLDTVNKIFSQPEAADGVVAKNEKVNHLPYRVGEWGKVEIWPLIIKDEAQNNDENDNEYSYLIQKKKTSPKYQLARQIALKIKDLMAKSLSTPRPLRFGDFMILVQKRSHFMNEFIRACKESNVNVSGADRMNLLEQIAIQDLISLAEFLLLPNDDLSLAEVLKSPLFNLTDDDLFKLCWNRKNANLWSKLKDFTEYRSIYEQLQNLFNLVDFVRPFELFNYVLTKMNGRRNFILRMGYEVEDSLDEFMNLVLNFEKEHIPSLQNFVEWITSHSCEVKREIKQNESDAVRIMTAHGSKGLQARVVFLPDTTIGNNVKNEQKLLVDEDGGVAYYPFCKDNYDEKCKYVNQNDALKDAEERRRLLYVALTRAEDELYVCGYANSLKDLPEDSWYSLCRRILEKEGKEQTGGEYTYETAGYIAQKQKSDVVYDNKMPEVPAWINEFAKPESALSKPYTPSKIENDEDVDTISPLTEQGNYFKRGTIIHKLLQFLPQTKENHKEIIAKYLSQTGFSENQQKQIETEVLSLLNTTEFSDIFGQYSKAEVPIMGEINGRIFSAQIDRLIIMPDKIKIVDFKTNRRIDEIPQAYVNQLKIYAELIKRIYPDKPVETYILWTNKLKLTRIS